MSTTMFIPMPEWQALLFLRDRCAAFQRLLSPKHSLQLRAQEVAPKAEGLYGFRQRHDALAYGRRVYPDGFAMVRLVIPKLLSSSMALRRHFTTSHILGDDLQVWLLDNQGLTQVAESCVNNGVEVMVDQIFGAHKRLVGEPCVSGDCSPDTADHEH